MKNTYIAAGILIGILGIIFLVAKSNHSPSDVVVQSHRTYHVQSDSQGKAYAVNVPSEYSFSVVDEQGNTLKDFAVTHTKQMHVVVVRQDLKYFQHIHPDFDATTGVFSFKGLTFPADGMYRIFADFAPGTSQMDSMGMPLTVTVSEDVPVGVGANYTPEPLGTEDKTKKFDGLTVTLATHGTPTSGIENMLMFSISQNRRPVTDLQSYLGALGHSVILGVGTLDFIHAHPMEDVSAPQNGTVDFMVNFPEAGKYKVFTQFQRGGKVITTDFVITVAQGTSANPMEGPNMQMQGMDHSNMQMTH